MTELPDLSQVIDKPGLFAAFAAQVKKDFESCGVESGFIQHLPSDYTALQTAFINAIGELNSRRPSKISELLYRVDISELQLKKFSLQRPDLRFEAVIAELIIRRELQKVVIRKFGI